MRRQRLFPLKPLETPGAAEGEFELVGVQRVQHDHVVPVKAKVV